MAKDTLKTVSEILLIIGGLNWGLYGLAGMDLVNMLVGGIPPLDTVVYALVGLAGLYELYALVAKK